MPAGRTSYLDSDSWDRANSMAFDNLLDDGQSTLRFLSALQPGLKQLRGIGSEDQPEDYQTPPLRSSRLMPMTSGEDDQLLPIPQLAPTSESDVIQAPSGSSSDIPPSAPAAPASSSVGAGPPSTAPGTPPAIAGRNPAVQARIYAQARASGRSDEDARILTAVSETEGGTEGQPGDNGQAHGIYQFHDKGQMPDFRAWVRRNNIPGDPNQLAVDPEIATRYAAEGYLGQALDRGRALGYSGAELATYVQRTGQRSVDPGKTGANYTRLFGPGAAPSPGPATSATVSPTQAASESRAQSGETRTGAIDAAGITAQYKGQPYVFGGSGGRSTFTPGAPTDCSGFVASVWKNTYGLDLAAHTDGSYNQLRQLGAPEVSQADARPGDIVYYMGAGTGGAIAHHMGIYSGNGKVLDMSVSGGGGVRERDIGHAGQFVILRDPRINPQAPTTAFAPPPIVPSADSGGTRVSRADADALIQDAAAPPVAAAAPSQAPPGVIPPAPPGAAPLAYKAMGGQPEPMPEDASTINPIVGEPDVRNVVPWNASTGQTTDTSQRDLGAFHADDIQYRQPLGSPPPERDRWATDTTPTIPDTRAVDEGPREQPYPGTVSPIVNPDRSVTTERSITVTEPELNGGRPTNIPTVWSGQVVSDDDAVTNAVNSGRSWPSYRTIDEAETAAQQRSADLGAGRLTSIGGTSLPYDPRAADQGAHELPTTTYNDPTTTGTQTTPLPTPVAPTPSPLKPLYDLGGQIIGYVHAGAEAVAGAAQGVADQAYQALEPARRAAASLDNPPGYDQPIYPGEPFDPNAQQGSVIRALQTPIMAPPRSDNPNDRTPEDIRQLPYQAADVGRQSVVEAAQTFADAIRAGQEGRPLAAAGNALWGAIQTAGLPWTEAARTINAALPEMNIAGVGPGDVAVSMDLVRDGINGVNRLRGLLTPENMAAIADAPGRVAGAVRGGAEAVVEGGRALGARIGEGRRTASELDAADPGGPAAYGTLGALPGQPRGRPTVEVLREQLDVARQAVADARTTGNQALVDTAADRAAAIESQLVDAVNSRRAAEPAITSDYGRRIEQTPSEIRGDESLERVNAARGYSPHDNSPVPPNFDQQPLIRDTSPAGRSINLNAGAGTLPPSAPTDRLGVVNRVLGQGAASSVSGGVGAAVNQQANPDDPNAALKGFLAGALVPPLAARGGRALARRAGAAPAGAEGALGTLGNVPEGGAGLGRLGELFPDAASWYRRSKARNVSEMAASNITPPSKAELVRGTVGTVGYGSMLGPGTAAFNVAASLMQPIWSIPKEPARAIGRAIETGNPAALREPAAMMGGVMTGFGHVGEALWDVIRARGKYAPSPDAPALSQRIADPIGRGLMQALETPGRAWAGGPDAIFGTLAQYAVEGRRAAQLATEAGHSGQKWQDWADLYRKEVERVRSTNAPAHQIGAGTADVIAAGEEAARRAAYRQPLGDIGKKVRQVARLGDFPVFGNFVAPFFNSPWNIHLQGLERSPAGLVMNTQPSKFDKYYDAAVGTAAVLGLAELVRDGVVDLSGSGPSDANERQAWLDAGNRPYSMKVGGVSIPTRAFASAETLLNATGETLDFLRYQKQGADSRALSGDALGRIGKLIKQAPYAAGYATIADTVQYGLPAAAADLATRATPGASTLRAIGTAVDPNERAVDSGAGVPMADEARQRWQLATGQRGTLPVAQNILGEPKENTQQGPGAFFGRFGFEKDDPVIGILRASRTFPPDPRREITLDPEDGVKITLLPSERRLWDAERGKVIRQAGTKLAGNPRWASMSEAAKQDVLHEIFNDAADVADARVLQAVGKTEITRRVKASAPGPTAGR